MGERSLRAANEVALGSGRLSPADASSLVRAWSGAPSARRQTLDDAVKAAEGMGFRVERHHAG